MDADRDLTRIVRSWLRTDEHESADRVLDEVLGRLDTTPQRRSWWPARRISDMNTYARLAVAAAAVVIVAVVGINLVSSRDGTVGPGATASPTPVATASPESTPTPTPTPAPTATPAPTPVAFAFPPEGTLVAGRHEFTINGVPFSLELKTSWISNGSWGIDKSPGTEPDGAGFIIWQDPPIGVFADPCARTESPPAGSLDALAAAVASIPGTDLVSGPTDVVVGGYPAKRVVITIRDDITCSPGSFYLWYGSTPGNARYASQVGGTIRSWAIDVNGKIVWIDGETYAGAGPKPGREIQQIIDSIQFE